MGFWDKLKGELLQNGNDNAHASGSAHTTDLAACVLLLEIAHADDDFSEAEASRLLTILMDEFDLSLEAARQLSLEAETQRNASLDLYQFTETLNKQLPKAHRLHIVTKLWEVVFADGRLDGHEDHLMHRLGDLLNLEHRDLIQAKLAAKHKK